MVRSLHFEITICTDGAEREKMRDNEKGEISNSRKMFFVRYKNSKYSLVMNVANNDNVGKRKMNFMDFPDISRKKSKKKRL